MNANIMAGRDYVLVLLATLFVGVFLRTFVIDAVHIRTASMADTLVPGDVAVVNKLAYGPSTPSTIPFTSLSLPSLRLPSVVSFRCGDVVLVERHLPSGETVRLVKRIVGTPGDTILIRGGTVYRNGIALPLPVSARAEVVGESDALAVPRAGELLRISPDTLPMIGGAMGAEAPEFPAERPRGLPPDSASRGLYRVKHDWYYLLGDNRPNSIDSRVWGFVTGAEIVGRVVAVYWSWDEESARRGGPLAGIRWSRIGSIVR